MEVKYKIEQLCTMLKGSYEDAGFAVSIINENPHYKKAFNRALIPCIKELTYSPRWTSSSVLGSHKLELNGKNMWFTRIMSKPHIKIHNSIKVAKKKK